MKLGGINLVFTTKYFGFWKIKIKFLENQNKMNFGFGTDPNVTRLTLLQLPYKKIGEACYLNKLSSQICLNDDFWQEKYRNDFGETPMLQPGQTYRDLYISKFEFVVNNLYLETGYGFDENLVNDLVYGDGNNFFDDDGHPIDDLGYNEYTKVDNFVINPNYSELIVIFFEEGSGNYMLYQVDDNRDLIELTPRSFEPEVISNVFTMKVPGLELKEVDESIINAIKQYDRVEVDNSIFGKIMEL